MKHKGFGKGAVLFAGLITGVMLATFTSFAYDSASLTSCTVENGNSIVVKGTASRSDPSEDEIADDGYYYLFELAPYETGIGDRTDYISWSDKVSELEFTLPYSWSAYDDMLYSHFVVALKLGDTYSEISNNIYVTNPQDVAKWTEDYPDAMSKKGLSIELSMLSDAMNLGVKHTEINISLNQILGGDLAYTYNGKTYYFNSDVIEMYDKMISSYSNKSIIVSAIILNSWTDLYPELRAPGVTCRDDVNYYGFNVSTPEGYETTRAIITFLAERYSGAHDSYGRISNWIIGNEVNNNLTWDYYGPMDVNTYAETYGKAFRVAYTAIRSQNKNARVFFSIDEMWQMANTEYYYGGRDFLDAFNSYIRSEGNIDWNLAYHPYPYPMTEPEWWDDHLTGMVADSVDSPVVSLENIDILTDYMTQPEFLTANGQVRHIILSEQGFTSWTADRGNIYDVQAAAYAYAYYLIDANPYIDAFILSRQVDAQAEMDTGCYFGLWTLDPNEAEGTAQAAYMPKNIYTVFKYIDTPSSLKHTEFAKSIIGIDKWSDVIEGFKLEE